MSSFLFLIIFGTLLYILSLFNLCLSVTTVLHCSHSIAHVPFLLNIFSHSSSSPSFSISPLSSPFSSTLLLSNMHHTIHVLTVSLSSSLCCYHTCLPCVQVLLHDPDTKKLLPCYVALHSCHGDDEAEAGLEIWQLAPSSNQQSISQWKFPLSSIRNVA